MFKGYRQDGWKVSGGSTTTEERRRIVINGISDWLRILDGEDIKKVTKLSYVEGGDRIVKIKYHNHSLVLNDAGDTVGIVDLETDEIEFWNNIIKEIKEGEWDSRINRTVERIKKAFKKNDT